MLDAYRRFIIRGGRVSVIGGMLCLLLAGCLAMLGCSYKVASPTATTVEIHSSYENRIKGNWGIVVDKRSTTFEREISPSSYVCSMSNFIFTPGDSIRISSVNTLKKVFENATLLDKSPTKEDMEKSNLDGYALVELEGFVPRIACRSGFWSGKCTVDVDIEFGINVRSTGGKLLGISVGSRKAVDGDSGAFCGAISELFSEAYRQALSDSMEEMAEEVSNSSRIREYVSQS